MMANLNLISILRLLVLKIQFLVIYQYTTQMAKSGSVSFTFSDTAGVNTVWFKVRLHSTLMWSYLGVLVRASRPAMVGVAHTDQISCILVSFSGPDYHFVD